MKSMLMAVMAVAVAVSAPLFRPMKRSRTGQRVAQCPDDQRGDKSDQPEIRKGKGISFG